MAETKAEIVEQPPVGRFGKLIISILFFGITNCWEKVSRLFGPAAPGRCTTLYYHCVLPRHRLGFARQMDMLLKRAVPVPVDCREPLAPGKRYAAVTFDDGLQASPKMVSQS